MTAPIEYEQTDKRWASVPYTITGSAAQNIGTSGCGPTCAAMVVATLRDGSITPVEAAAWSVANGYLTKRDGTYHSFFPAYLRKWAIAFLETTSVSAALAALAAGKMVISCCRAGSIWTASGHFVLAYGLADGGKRVLIHDPNSELAKKEQASVADYRNGCIKFWIIDESWEDKIMKFYQTISEVPEWYRAAVQKMIDKGHLKGTGKQAENGEDVINISEDNCRLLTWLDRMGLLEIVDVLRAKGMLS